jgi:hypothetical protein
MSVLSLRLPDSIHDKARELAERDGISLNQLIATALAEKLSVMLTTKYLEERAKRADAAKVRAILARVADVAPGKGDEVTPPSSKRSRRPASKRSSGRGR